MFCELSRETPSLWADRSNDGSGLARIFHRGWLALTDRWPAFRTRILLLEYDDCPAGGLGGRGFHQARLSPSLLAGTGLCCSGACGMAWIRCQAVMITSAYVHDAAIFRIPRRPPCTRRPAACRIR